MNRLRNLGLELGLMSSGHRAEFLWTLPLILTLTKHGVLTSLPCRNVDGDAVLCRAVWLRSGIRDPLPLPQTQTSAREVEKQTNVTLLHKVH